MHGTHPHKKIGFTLLELVVVVGVIVLMICLAVPNYLASVERAKVEEAFDFLATLRMQQDRYQATNGTYCDDLRKLGLTADLPQGFQLSGFAPGVSGSLEDTWTVTMTRLGASMGYGDYTLVFTQDGYHPRESTIQDFADFTVLSR